MTKATLADAVQSFENLLDALDAGAVQISPKVHRELVAQWTLIRAELANRETRRAARGARKAS